MTFLSIEAFVPSGNDYDKSKRLFEELGFEISWDAGDCAGLAKDGCKFILQNYDVPAFAENLMLSVKVTDVIAFSKEIAEKKLAERFGIRISDPTDQPYGKEVTMIDIAGVCWHFIQDS